MNATMDKKAVSRERQEKENLLYAYLGCALGIVTIVIGILFAACELPKNFMVSTIRSAMILAPDSSIYPDWIDAPVPIYMNFYIFNVTNKEDILKGEIPRVEECGPYVYSMKARKFNVTFYSNSTVSFYNNFTLHFEPGMSTGAETDQIYHLNVPLSSMGVMMQDVNDYFGFMDRMVQMSGGGDLFPSHTAYEILFGYRDPIFSVLDKISMFTGREVDPYFGFFRDFNNSHDGHYLMYTGQKRRNRAYQISKWNGGEYLNFWSTKYANKINGSDGSFLGHDLTKSDTPYLYFPQMFRSQKLEYEGEKDVRGVPTIRFHLSDDFLANTTINPDNAGFCVPPGNCFDSGVLNIESCMEGAPGFVSLPHFYNAAPLYQNALLGLTPDKEKHDSLYYAEPITGAVLESHRRLQINMLLKPSELFKSLKNVRETIFPVLWLSGSAVVDEKIAEKLKLALVVIKYIDISSYAVLCTGILLLCMFGYSVVKKRTKVRLRHLIPLKKISRESADSETQ